MSTYAMLRSLQQQYKFKTQLGENLILLAMPSVKMNQALLQQEMSRQSPGTRSKSVVESKKRINQLNDQKLKLGVKIKDQTSLNIRQAESTRQREISAASKSDKSKADAHDDRKAKLDAIPQKIYEQSSWEKVSDNLLSEAAKKRVTNSSTLRTEIGSDTSITKDILRQAIREMMVANSAAILGSAETDKVVINKVKENITVGQLTDAWIDRYGITLHSDKKPREVNPTAHTDLFDTYEVKIDNEFKAGGGKLELVDEVDKDKIARETAALYKPSISELDAAIEAERKKQGDIDGEIAGMYDPSDYFRSRGITSMTQMPVITTKPPSSRPKGDPKLTEVEYYTDRNIELDYPKGTTESEMLFEINPETGTLGKDDDDGDGTPNFDSVDWMKGSELRQKRAKQDEREDKRQEIAGKILDTPQRIRSAGENLLPDPGSRRAARNYPDVVGDEEDADIVDMESRRQARRQARRERRAERPPLTASEFDRRDFNDDEYISIEEDFLPGKVIEGFGKIIDFTEDPVTGRIASVRIRTPEGKIITKNMAAEIDLRRESASSAIKRLQDYVANKSMDAEDAQVQIDEIRRNFQNKSEFERAFEKVMKDMVD